MANVGFRFQDHFEVLQCFLNRKHQDHMIFPLSRFFSQNPLFSCVQVAGLVSQFLQVMCKEQQLAERREHFMLQELHVSQELEESCHGAERRKLREGEEKGNALEKCCIALTLCFSKSFACFHLLPVQTHSSMRV